LYQTPYIPLEKIMKNSYFVLMFISIVMLNAIIEKSAPAQSAPNKIYNCQDLQNMKYGLSSSYQLANDIDCSSTVNWNNGRGFLPVGVRDSGQTPPVNNPFVGQFDGQNHSINNLYINGTIPGNVGVGTYNTGNVSIGTSNPNGLFGSVSGVISNVKLNNAVVQGAGNSGALVGELISGTINNVQVSGKVTGSWAGGLVGVSYSQNINQASANVQVTGANATSVWLGGLVGYSGSGTISNSSSTGSVLNLNGKGNAFSGGLIGYVNNTSIVNAYSTSSITQGLNGNTSVGVGGLVGGFYAYGCGVTYGSCGINQSYAAGAIQLTGSVSSNENIYTGGLVGQDQTGTAFNDDYWDAQRTGQASSAGSPNTNGLSTVQMFITSNYVGFDPTYTWAFDAQRYPVLRWQEQGQIDLWNIYDVINQNLINSSNDQNWSNLDYLNHTGINWVNMLLLSRPSVWNDIPVTQGAINWASIDVFSNSPINWIDVAVLSRTGINWSSVNPFGHIGINWADWLVATTTGINWNGINIANNAGVNWISVGLVNDDVNWNDLSVISRTGLNWVGIEMLGQENVNWDDPAILKKIPLTPTNLHTLRSIGVNDPVILPTAQVSLGFGNSAGSGVITSSPVGFTIFCSVAPNKVCTGTFALNQPITLTFSSSNNSIVTNWGISGCTSGKSTCVLTPNAANTFVNVTVNPSIPLITSYSPLGPQSFSSTNPNILVEVNTNEPMVCKYLVATAPSPSGPTYTPPPYGSLPFTLYPTTNSNQYGQTISEYSVINAEQYWYVECQDSLGKVTDQTTIGVVATLSVPSVASLTISPTADGKHNLLNWSPVTTKPVGLTVQYVIYRSLTGVRGSYAAIGSTNLAGNWTDATSAQGGTYWYYVNAIITLPSSPTSSSNIVKATVPAKVLVLTKAS